MNPVKSFFNLEKNLGNQHQICKLIFDEKEIDKTFMKYFLKMNHPKMEIELKNIYALLLLHLLTRIK